MEREPHAFVSSSAYFSLASSARTPLSVALPSDVSFQGVGAGIPQEYVMVLCSHTSCEQQASFHLVLVGHASLVTPGGQMRGTGKVFYTFSHCA